MQESTIFAHSNTKFISSVLPHSQIAFELHCIMYVLIYINFKQKRLTNTFFKATIKYCIISANYICFLCCRQTLHIECFWVGIKLFAAFLNKFRLLNRLGICINNVFISCLTRIDGDLHYCLCYVMKFCYKNAAATIRTTLIQSDQSID